MHMVITIIIVVGMFMNLVIMIKKMVITIIILIGVFTSLAIIS